MCDQPELSGLFLRGIGITDNRAAGRLRFLRSADQRSSQAVLSPSDPATEWGRLQAAVEKAKRSTNDLFEHALASVGEQEAEIFRIHGMLLCDKDLLDSMHREIARGTSAEEAVQGSVREFASVLRELQDPYLSARIADLEDIAGQIQRALVGEERYALPSDSSPCILVAEDLSPSETVLLDKSKVLGFVTFRGTPNSHTAILARAMGIPALVGVGRIDPLYDGSYALLDACEGSLILRPTKEQEDRFSIRQEQDGRITEDHDRYLRSLLSKPAVTASGHRMMIYANIGNGDEVDAVLAGGADGIGLLRSEFLYLGLRDYPSEETLFHAYADIALRMNGKRTVIRTLDVGADKQIPYFHLPSEENPALGFRAIRVCLAHRDVFRTQLRAILRASAMGRLAVMLPMIVSADEVRESRCILKKCMQELSAEGLRFDPDIEFGIMIETPAAAILSPELADTVDFFSVGTNDLLQYTLAADRQNPMLFELCERNTEPILRLIEMSAKAIHEKGGWIGICGEMAADLRLTQRFADLGIDELSVSPPCLLGLRGKVSECQ